MARRSALPLLRLAGVCLAGALCAGAAAEPEAVLGHTDCAECHENSALLWEKTRHARSFNEVHRSDEGRDIASKMEVKRVKGEGSPCLGCHYTVRREDDGSDKPIAGVSCESCHGPGRDWLPRHSEFSGKEEADETAEEEAQRWADSEAHGMIRPGAILALASNCFGCHVVPDEELINKGGHTAGSDFELVSWTQGEVRHNVWYTDANEVPGTERLRMLYVLGLAADLEHSLRALAKATAKAEYAVSMAKRVQRARLRLQQLAEAAGLPELDALSGAAASAQLKLNNAAELNGAADAVAAAAAAVAADHDGSRLAAADALIPGPDKYRGEHVP